MKPSAYPFAAVVGQSEMKLALLLAAVDWRLGVLLRGDKGSGKTTAARALAALLPPPAPFINLPIGTTEDRLLGGLHLERTLKGDPVLKPGLLAEAHGGVLYVDEVNLLPAHLGDSLLDAAASGVHVVEREGMSASYPAEFILLGSMNPEEGSLRPQLMDRFALSVSVQASLDPAERRVVMERRILFERDPMQFAAGWAAAQESLQTQIISVRASLGAVTCSGEMMEQISSAICDQGVRSLRADLAVMRSALAYAALHDDACVESFHVAAVLPLVLAHRCESLRSRSQPPATQMQPPQPPSSKSDFLNETQGQEACRPGQEHVFAAAETKAPAIEAKFNATASPGNNPSMDRCDCGPVVRTRQSDRPVELDIHATLSHALRETGALEPRIMDLHERVREPRTGTRYLFVIDSSGSHAAQQRMRLVKGAISGLLSRSFKRGDEVALLVFRGTTAQVILEPTQVLRDAFSTLEYLPTGGRTPLAAALLRAGTYLTPETLFILLSDGRANVPLHGGDPWQEALDTAGQITCSAIVVDTETGAQRLGQCAQLAEVLSARYLSLDEFGEMENLSIDAPRQRQGA
jgi:magnesium chelatase subunit D